MIKIKVSNENLKKEIKKFEDVICETLLKGNDILIKYTKNGLKILKVKRKTI